MGRVEVTDAGTVEAGVGDEVVIRLPENATTGYVWTVTVTGLELVDDEMVPPGADKGVGAAGERLVRVRAVAPGRGEVVLRLGRAWEQTPVEERRVVVLVCG